jgi:hypothetical protein
MLQDCEWIVDLGGVWLLEIVLCPERIEAIALDRFLYMRREYSSVSFWDFRTGLLGSLGPVSEITCPLLIF